MSSPLPPEVQAALQEGQKLQAIRLLRQHTGLDLKSAKEAVESGVLPQTQSLIGKRGDDVSRQLRAALDAGQLSKAIKMLWQGKQIDPAAAADPFHSASHGATRRSYRPGGLGPGEMPRGSLGPALLAISIGLGAVLAWVLLSSA